MRSEDSQPAARRWHILLALLLAFAYTAWAIPFMLESSVVAIDGRRYYGLFDDAMISMRYAWNLSHGNGLVWNPGERVEGFTNLLWTLILSIFTGLMDKVSAVLAVQILGIVIVLACAFLAWKVTRAVTVHIPEGDSQALSAAVAVMTLLYYPLSYWTLTGMETGLLTLLLLAALIALERYTQRRTLGRGLIVGLFLGLAYLAREDAAIYAVPVFIYMARLPTDEGKTPQRTWIAAMLLFCAFPICREIFRLAYYGELLPNTYFLKLTGMPLPVRLQSGLGFSSLYFITHAVFLGVGLAGIVMKPDRRKHMYLALVVLPILYQIWTGGDPVRIWRMVTPAQPIAALLFALGAYEIAKGKGATSLAPTGVRVLGYLTALAVLTVNFNFTPFILLRERWFPLDFYRARISTAVALNEITTEDARVALLAAGVVPYYTGLRAHDMLGRTDAYIASLPADISGAVAWGGMQSVPGHNKYDLDYSIKRLLPTYVEASAWGAQDITNWMPTHYDRVNYKGVEMWLLRGSPDVKWKLLTP